MADSKLIVILGATGVQGGSVVEKFLTEPSWKVRAITRKASSPKAQALQSRGAEIVEADLNNVSSLQKAFEGAHAIFGVTDFWTLFIDQSVRSQLKPGQKMVELCHDLETQQGKNIFDAAAKVSTLERLVFSGLPNVNKWSNGKYTKSYHFDSKAKATEYAQKTYPELWSKTSIIQLGYFLTNFRDHPFATPAKNEATGVYEFYYHNPEDTLCFVAAEEETGIYVKTLISSAPGKNCAVYRQRMSLVEYAKLWAKFNGVEARVIQGALVQAPEELHEDLHDTFAFGHEYGTLAEKVDKSLVLPEHLGLKLGTVEDWIKAQDWSQVIKG